MNKEVFYPRGALMPVVLDKTVHAKQMYLEFDFRDKNQIGKLLPILVDEFVLELDNEPDYMYRCQILSMGNSVVMDDYDSYTVGFDVVVVKEGTEVLVTLANVHEQVLMNEGTYASYVKYVITANRDVYDFEINGIVITKLLGNETIIIDGENKVITFGDGSNAFGRCVLYEFPKIIPGSNTVIMNHYDNVSVQVSYKPVFF